MRQPKTLRWTLRQAADEFGLAERTIKRRLNELGTVPNAEDGMYSTGQIHAAVCESNANATRKIRAEADLAELDLAAKRREVVDVALLAAAVNRAIAAIKAHIDGAANLEREDKDKILRQCGDLWDQAFGVQPVDGASRSEGK